MQHRLSLLLKNGSLCGVKTGMKKDDAIKNLQKSLGKKAVSETAHTYRCAVLFYSVFINL